jgi:hypothetical protein
MVRQLGSVGLIVAIVTAICSLQTTQALAGEWHRQAKSGQPTHIGSFSDCRTHFPLEGSAFVEHGTVSFTDAFENKCGNPHEPAKVIWYTSKPGFKGSDTVRFPRGNGYRSLFDIVVE